MGVEWEFKISQLNSSGGYDEIFKRDHNSNDTGLNGFGVSKWSSYPFNNVIIPFISWYEPEPEPEQPQPEPEPEQPQPEPEPEQPQPEPEPEPEPEQPQPEPAPEPVPEPEPFDIDPQPEPEPEQPQPEPEPEPEPVPEPEPEPEPVPEPVPEPEQPQPEPAHYTGLKSRGQYGEISISYNFKYVAGSNTDNAIVTFERYPGMNGIVLPFGDKYKHANREQDTITLTWDSYNIEEQSIILFDVASGYSLHEATISTDKTNLYNDIVVKQSNYNIKAYVYQLKINDIINLKPYKYFNTAIKNFQETNTSDLVKKNRELKIDIIPILNNTSIPVSIFDYNDTITGVSSSGQDPDRTNPIDTLSTFLMTLKLEKIDMENYISGGFSNATNVSGNINNSNLLNDIIIYLTNNNYSNSNGYQTTSPNITIDISNDSIDNIALGKGLIDDIENQKNAFDTDLFLFLLHQNFLTDYWEYKPNISHLSLPKFGATGATSSGSNTILDSRINQYDYQRKIALSIHVVNFSLSGQIFLINSAKSNNNISYINSVTSEIIDTTQVTTNPIMNFNKIDNVYPAINNSNPIYIKLTNITSNSNTVYPVSIYPFPVTFDISLTTSNISEIDQPLYPGNNIFDINSIFSNTGNQDKTISTVSTPTATNGIYYFDMTCGASSNSKLINYNIFPGTIMVNVVELPDINKSDTTINLSSDNRKINITWPRYYYNTSQGDITWTIIRQDMSSFVKVTRTYTISSSEITIVGDNIVYEDTDIRRFDKYQYTISGKFNFTSTININNIPKNYSLSLDIQGFTTDTIFICYGYTTRFPFGRFNTTTTNLKLFVPKLLRTDINPTTKSFFSNQLLLTNPAPPGTSDEYHLANNITSWPGGRGACTSVTGDVETFGRTLTQVNENIYSNTSNQLSRKQIFNLLSKSRFRPDR